ncbi:MAG TPA: response regulator [Acidimicrobiales bacterium]|nr:response regulator [Acidimicrobiales bacterium]
MSHFFNDGEPRPKALICDDDPMIRRLVREVAERCGYDILAGVDNAVDALSLVMEHRPEVLVLDLALPGMGGEEVIAAIQELPGTTVVVHSAHDPRFAVKAGARTFVSKGNVALLEKTLLKVRGAEISA